MNAIKPCLLFVDEQAGEGRARKQSISTHRCL